CAPDGPLPDHPQPPRHPQGRGPGRVHALDDAGDVQRAALGVLDRDRGERAGGPAGLRHAGGQRLSLARRSPPASRATPPIHIGSPRLGKVLTVSTVSRSPTASTTSAPTSVSGGSTRMPAW